MNEVLQRHGVKANLRTIGLPDKFIDQGTKKELNEMFGLSREGIKKAVLGMVK